MSTHKKHYVTFLSPGTLFSETTTKPIESWDVRLATKMARDVHQRHGARPFAFQFVTRTKADPVDDGQGGTLRVESREEERSGLHFIGGTVLSFADVEARGDELRNVLANMQGDRLSHVIESTRSYRAVLPFRADDVVVNEAGDIVTRGRDVVGVEA